MEQKKQIITTLKFRQTYELMKNYLAKKRFNYVYEQCIKYYNKNQAYFSNHQVLMIIKLVFYVLKKKMILKSNPNTKNFSVNALSQIYSIMTNIYLSWENVLMQQMKAENVDFFQMIFKNYKLKANKNNELKPDNLLFQPKKDYIITGKINSEYKIYNFFKQGLLMVINSLIVMMSDISFQKVKRMIILIKKSQQIMNRFPQHLFPIQKIQFYLVKCQIMQFIRQKCAVCLDFKIQYQFPLGLFTLIYKNIYKWNQAKLHHYAKLLIKMVFYSMKFQLISIKQAYVLGNEIKNLIFISKVKEKQSDRKPSIKVRKGILDTKQSMLSEQANKKNQKNQRNNQKKSTQFIRSKNKTKISTYLYAILDQINKFIQENKQIAYITRIYLQDVYLTYKNNLSHQNDQIIDQIPVLIQKQNKKARKNITNQPSSNQKYNSSLFNSQKTKRQSLHEDEHNHQFNNSFFIQNNPIKHNKIILRNILNVKHKKNLKLSNTGKGETNFRNSRSKQNSKSTAASDSVVLGKNNKDNKDNKIDKIGKIQNKFPYETMVKQISHNAFQQLNVFQKFSLQEPLDFLNESSSDQQYQMQYEFQKKRRSQIRQLNHRFYKRQNMNYKKINRNNNESQDSQFRSGNGQKSKRSYDDDYQSSYTLNTNKKLKKTQNRLKIDNIKNKNISEDIEFQQIKLLDQVIKQKILSYLNMQLDNLSFYSHQNYKQNSQNHDHHDQQRPYIQQYSNVMRKTKKLKQEVDQLNKQRKLMCDKFNYKSLSLQSSYLQQTKRKEEQNEKFHYGILKDLDNLYNTKNNLIQKSIKCIKLYRKLIKLDQRSELNPIFKNTIKKYGDIYRKYGQNLSIIGQTEQQWENTRRQSQQIPLIEYIVQNRPISLLQKTLKQKQKQKKFSIHHKMQEHQKKQIALRQSFDNLRGDICKAQFSQSNSLTKNFVIKKQIEQGLLQAKSKAEIMQQEMLSY